MKKITILLSFLITIFFAKAQCDYVVDMQDSYGDGWNGASIDMLINGVVMTSFTVTTLDATAATASYSTYSGDNVEFYFNSGTWDTEITFQITAPDGSSVGSYGPYPANTGNSYSVWTGVSNATCTQNSNCLDLTALTAGLASTSSSIDLSWTPGGANSTSYNIEYGAAGFTLGTGTSLTTSNSSYTITGLSSSTSYDFYVQGDCGATNGVSNWVGPVTAQTIQFCAVVSAPYLENFDGTPSCWLESSNDVFDWSQVSGATPSTGTGPSDDITTGGSYMFIETSLPRVLGDSAILNSPALDLTSMTSPKLTFYSHMYGGAIGTLRVDASNDGGATYSNVFTKSGDQGDQWNFEIVSLSGFSDTVMFKVIAIVGDDNGQAWTSDIAIDNFEISESVALDVSGISMTTPPTIILANGPVTVSGKLQNMGTSTVTTMDVNYTIDGGATVTESVSGLNLATGNYYDFSHGTTWSPAAAGSYVIAVWATNINGATDMNTSNDMVSGTVTVYDNATIRRPMLESFTSSTCGPCVAGNVNVASVLTGYADDQYSLLKYQMSWPGSGDPYYTDEGGDRRTYYGVNAVPDFILDGNDWQGNSSSLANSQIDAVLAEPAFLEMSSFFTVTGQTVDITVNIDALGDFNSNLTIYTAIYEIKTFNNVGSNGETEFGNVMKKMVPSSQGFNLGTLQTGNSVTENFSHTFAGNYVLPPNANSPIDHATQHSIEDFNNLGVVTWIQDDATKEVIQSTVSTISATNVEELSTTKLMLFPNPADNTATVAFEGLEGSDVKIDLYNLLGELVFTGNHTSASNFDYYNIDVTTLNNGIYNLVLSVGESITTKKLQIIK